MSNESQTDFDPATDPPKIFYRENARTTLRRVIGNPAQHLYLTGPRGTGKTLLVRNALAAQSIPTYYLSCIRHDTQYKVLAELFSRITDTDVSSGYHTAQLQQRIGQCLRDTAACIVLDDLTFLLDNDGNDLLYFLSRLDHADLQLVSVSAVYPSLTGALDERTYSTLRPHRLTLPRYTPEQVVTILTERVDATRSAEPVETAALEYIADRTTNLTLALHWLASAATTHSTITVDGLQAVQEDAVERYRATLLEQFTWHHRLLLAVIDQTTADAATATTGTAYNRYVERCEDVRTDPLTARRVSDYLTHLELLNLIDVTHYHGGSRGKTREIQPTPLQEL